MIKQTLEYWRTKFDWSETVSRINKIPQFTTDILGLKIHFWHLKAEVEDAPTVLMLHGWPDSVYGFHGVVSHLKGRYNIVVPSLPGYGWSEASRVKGLCPVEVPQS